jgi:hypothetical protein
MKNKRLMTILTALFAIALSFTSCEEDEKPLSETLVGKWEVESERQIYSIGNDKKFEYLLYYDPEELAFEFTSGGSMIVYQGGDVYSMLAYALSGNTLTIETSGGNMVWKNVTVDGNTLSWSEFVTDVINEVTYSVEIIYTTAKVE